jgi:DMSO/TMAO reductase YedYZ molybdopterin-dependent catalytic subunit
MTYVIFYVGVNVLNKKLLVIASVFIVLLLTSSVAIMIWWTTREPFDLGYSEIREYEGKDLSSINNFRENSIKGPQQIDNQTYTLTLTGLVKNELELTYNDVLSSYQSYKKVVTLNCVEGWRVTILWEGIKLQDMLSDAEVSSTANTVIFRAYDGYSTSLPLDYIIDNNILMAYKMNNVTLPPERGYPFQLVAESKWGYKWIKWITSIELSDNPDYKGFWESRGWDNDADL